MNNDAHLYKWGIFDSNLEKFFGATFQETDSGVQGNRSRWLTVNVENPPSQIQVIATHISQGEDGYSIMIYWTHNDTIFLSIGGQLGNLEVKDLGSGGMALIFNQHNNTYSFIRSAGGQFHFKFDLVKAEDGLRLDLSKQYG